MKANRVTWLLLSLLLGSGCNQRIPAPPKANTAPTVTDEFGGVLVPASPRKGNPAPTNALTKPSELSDAEVGLAGPWKDFQGAKKQTNEWGFVIGEAIEETKAKAENGNAVAQLTLGMYYVVGQGVPQNSTEATKWLRKGAEQKANIARPVLALCYATLGFHYLHGMGVATDYTEAATWFRKGAELGDAKAQMCLGNCYSNGQGVPRDNEEAATWYGKAAAQGLAEAQASLGVSYLLGQGLSRNYAQAANWLLRAAEQGHSSAQALVGSCYADGMGVPVNDIEAYKWLSLAAAHEVRDDVREEAKMNLNSIEARMSREEIVAAQRLSAAFAPRKESEGMAKRASLFDDTIAGQMIRPKSSGTGFFISADGFLISNAHVVEGAAQVRLVTSAGLISARVVKVDAANDLALLKAEGRFAALPVAASRAVKLGGTVATVGFPNIGLQGFAPKLAKGEIASLSGAGDDARYFQISVPVQPGNSGGALVDERGNVVGVVSAKLSARAALSATGSLPENVNYAVKSSFLLGFLESMPEVSAKLKEPNAKEMKFDEVVKHAEQAAVLVLVY